MRFQFPTAMLIEEIDGGLILKKESSNKIACLSPHESMVIKRLIYYGKEETIKYCIEEFAGEGIERNIEKFIASLIAEEFLEYNE